MKLGNFTLQVVGGHEFSNGQVEITHGRTYKIRMRNHLPRRVDCVLWVDGDTVGTFRLSAYQTMTIDRPADKARLFTFFKLGTAEAAQAGLVDNSEIGLITGEFYPELEPEPIIVQWTARDVFPMAACSDEPVSKGVNHSAGGTGLTGHSSQEFINVGAINRDYKNKVTIHLRLVCKDDVPEIEPLGKKVSMSTAVPPRV